MGMGHVRCHSCGERLVLVVLDAIAFLPDQSRGCDKASTPAHSASIEIP